MISFVFDAPCCRVWCRCVCVCPVCVVCNGVCVVGTGLEVAMRCQSVPESSLVKVPSGSVMVSK